MPPYKLTLDPLTVTIFLAVVGLTAFAFIVCLPVVGITWIWNACFAYGLALPSIGFWQGALLYLALACIVYLSGIVHIELKTEITD